jgi:hypothetical protein
VVTAGLFVSGSGLVDGPASVRGDGDIGQALQPVAAQEEHIGYTAVLEVGEHRQPELRPLPTAARPKPEEVLLPGHETPIAA